jgi:hypothetical protein
MAPKSHASTCRPTNYPSGQTGVKLPNRHRSGTLGFRNSTRISATGGNTPSHHFSRPLVSWFWQKVESGRVLFSISSVITLPLYVPQSLAPAPVPQTESDSESSPFSDLPLLLRLSQPVAQSRAQTDTSQRISDAVALSGRPVYLRRKVGTNRPAAVSSN